MIRLFRILPQEPRSLFNRPFQRRQAYVMKDD